LIAPEGLEVQRFKGFQGSKHVHHLNLAIIAALATPYFMVVPEASAPGGSLPAAVTGGPPVPGEVEPSVPRLDISRSLNDKCMVVPVDRKLRISPPMFSIHLNCTSEGD
jgi:hypothetical protein